MEVDQPTLEALALALGRHLRGGEILLLRGPMGAGKTTFTRALAAGLGVDAPTRVRSPTFNLCVEHPGPITLVHLDLCRLGELGGEAGGQAAAFEALELEELTADVLCGAGGPKVMVVEWSELWPDPPPDHLLVTLHRTSEDRRTLTLEACGQGLDPVWKAWCDDVGWPAKAPSATRSSGPM